MEIAEFESCDTYTFVGALVVDGKPTVKEAVKRIQGWYDEGVAGSFNVLDRGRTQDGRTRFLVKFERDVAEDSEVISPIFDGKKPLEQVLREQFVSEVGEALTYCQGRNEFELLGGPWLDDRL